MRRNELVRTRNKSQLSTLKTYRKKFELSLGSTEGKTVDEAFRHAQSLIARAGRKGLIPKGRASRIIGKMMKKKVEHETTVA